MARVSIPEAGAGLGQRSLHDRTIERNTAKDNQREAVLRRLPEIGARPRAAGI